MNKKKAITITLTIACIAGAIYFLHPHNYKETVEKEANCTEEGTLCYSCWCGKEYEEHPNPAGHDYRSAITP